MKLDFNKQILDLDQNPIEGSNIGKTLATVLVAQPKGDALKFLEWAQKMYKGEVIDLDTSDQNTLKDFIKNSDQLTILLKGQALNIFEDTKSK